MQQAAVRQAAMPQPWVLTPRSGTALQRRSGGGAGAGGHDGFPIARSDSCPFEGVRLRCAPHDLVGSRDWLGQGHSCHGIEGRVVARGALHRRTQGCRLMEGPECTSHRLSALTPYSSSPTAISSSFHPQPATSLEASHHPGATPEAPSPPGVTRAAFFDVDGTLAKTNVVWPFAIARIRRLPWLQKVLFVARFCVLAVVYLVVDALDRSLFTRLFYRNYEGMATSEAASMAALVHQGYLKPRVFDAALQRIAELKRLGFRIVLITGSLNFLIAPLAKELGADEVVAATLEEKDGRFTGRLLRGTSSGHDKADHVRAYAAEHGLALEDCHAYGDSIADLEMLEAVGQPFCVKPDTRLRAIAQKRGWPTLDWGVSSKDELQSPLAFAFADRLVHDTRAHT